MLFMRKQDKRMGSQEDEVLLLGAWYSPYAYRVQWALKQKGVTYEVMEVDVFDRSPILLQYNPVLKKIPVLVHDGRPIVDSLCILEYIDETWKHNPILPQDPYERAMARFWANFIEVKLHKAVRRAKVFKGERKEKEVNQAKEALQVLEGQLKGKKFFGGDSVGYLDIVLGWITLWLGVFEEVASIKVLDGDECPLIDKWIRNFLEFHVIKEIGLPERERLVLFLSNYGQYPTAQQQENED